MTAYYLAGPMTGIPKFNYPAFIAAAKNLRAHGYKIISPAEQDSREKLEQIMLSKDGDLSKISADVGTWGDFLSHDVKLIADKVGGIILLDGWAQSRGARLEAFVAILCGHKFLLYSKDGCEPVWGCDIMDSIFDATLEQFDDES